MKKVLLLSTSCVLLVFLSCNQQQEFPEFESGYDHVNTFIGTGGHGHTYPGATLPFGMVQLSPDTRLEGWDGCSGYHNTDSIIYGFSHTHLSGTGVGDYGDVLLMPTRNTLLKWDNGYKTSVDSGYASRFNKESENARPGYYEVKLAEHDIDVRLTATERVGIHEYAFNKSMPSSIVLDLQHRDQLLDFSIRLVNDKEVEGYRISKAWAEEQHIYFVIQSNKAFTIDQLKKKFKKLMLNDNPKGAVISLDFESEKGEKVVLKVGISAVSIEGARKNLEAEAPHWDFEKYKDDAKAKWEKALNKIQVAIQDKTKKEIFYTALYHTMIAPNVFSDVDGKYRGMDLKIHQSDDGPVYTVFSLWDTFRATHPLFTIIEQEKTNEFIRTFLKQYQTGGILPIWELAANYTGCMIGYHAIPVIADAYIKGLRDYDTKLALEAMKHSGKQDKLGLAAYKAKGYIAAGDESESVSKTLEYAYDDWCIAMMAKAMGDEKGYKEYIERAQYFKNLFNPESGFMQPKMNGGWSTGFNPAEVNFNFTEANSWQYSLFAPQDIQGLIKLHGGEQQLEKKLDELFTTEMKLSGRHQADITGLIGQYAHGNEPSHHMAYMYNYVGKPYKTQERVHQILTEQYANKPDGLSGNEDCGQMSAWYVLSAMGFYAVTPGADYYAIGTPLFDDALINLENGNQFHIVANNVSDQNKYIQSATLNGEELNRAVLYHKQIMAGGEIVFEMGNQPNEDWGTDNMPVPSIAKADEIIPVPYFTSARQTFEDEMTITLNCVNSEAEIIMRTDDGVFTKYEKPFTIKSNTNLTVYAQKGEKKSREVHASFKKIDGKRSIELMSEYDNQYNAGGDNALIDQLKGTPNFRTGFWQGYYNTDVEFIVDLGELKRFQTIKVGALQDIKSWIWFPAEIEVWVAGSRNGHFKESGRVVNDFPVDKEGAFVKEFVRDFTRPIQSRFIKIKVKNVGPCPDWHLGAGNPTWIFLDEVIIE